MSYDLTIASDETFSRSTPAGPLAAVIRNLPGVVENGPCGFALDDRPDRWMEIDLEFVSEDGDALHDGDQLPPEINCVNLHIPYPFFREDGFKTEYLPIARMIAKHLGWPLEDLQTGTKWP